MITPRLGPDARNGSVAIWRDGYMAAMVRVETCLLAGDLGRLSREVNDTLTSDKRGGKTKAHRARRAEQVDVPDTTGET